MGLFDDESLWYSRITTEARRSAAWPCFAWKCRCLESRVQASKTAVRIA